MLEKIREIITDRRLLFAFFIGDILFRTVILKGLFPNLHCLWLSRLYLLYIPWTFCILSADLWERRSVWDGYTKLLWTYWVIAVIAAVINIPLRDTTAAIHHLSNYLMMSCVFFTVSKYKESERLLEGTMKLQIYTALVFNTATLVIFLLVSTKCFPRLAAFANSRYFFVNRSHEDGIRLAGLYYWPTTGANFCILAALFSQYLYEKKKLHAGVMGIVTLTTAILLRFFDCRSGILLAGFCLLAAVWRYIALKKDRRLAACLVSVLGILGLVMIGIWQVPKLMILIESRGLFAGVHRFLSGRLRFMRAVWEGLKRKPLLGFGFVQNVPSEIYAGSSWNTHNLVLNLLQWTGLAGLFVFGTFLGRCFRELRRKASDLLKKPEWWLLLIVGYDFGWAIFNYGIIGNQTEYTAFFWIILGTLLYGHK